MNEKSAASSGVEKLKWLVVPRQACSAMIADLGHEDRGAGPPDEATHSRPVAQVGEDPREREHVDRGRGGELRRLQPDGRASDDARVERPAQSRKAPSAPSISRAEAVSGLSVRHNRLSPARIKVTSAIAAPSMLPLSTSIYTHMLTVSTSAAMLAVRCPPAPARPRRKPRDRYHHGDLRRALLDEALRTIQDEGVEALTLRTIGLRLGVSRTALYRHFADKRALLSAVATEGFRLLRERLVDAWGSGGVRGFNAMGVAYIRFAMANPSHYRVMFGGFVDDAPRDEELTREGNSRISGPRRLARRASEGRRWYRKDDPLQLARFIWAAVHGISMLIIDGQLRHQQAQIDDLIQFAVERIHTGIATTNNDDGSSVQWSRPRADSGRGVCAMKTGLVVLIGAVASLAGVAADRLAAQSGATARTAPAYTPPRTPWGDPDLQGVYTNSNEYATPLERPKEFAGRRLEDLTAEELARVRQQATKQAIAGLANGDVRGPDDWWLQILDLAKRNQPWLIVDPPDGRIPP